MIQINNYHNTTGLIGRELKEAIKTVDKQDKVILQIFIQSGLALTPSEALSYCQIKGFNYLITSVRRTINTLTKEGRLMHTQSNKIGPYGKPEGLWVYWLN